MNSKSQVNLEPMRRPRAAPIPSLLMAKGEALTLPVGCRTQALSPQQLRCQNLESPGPRFDFSPVVLVSQLPSQTLHLPIVKMSHEALFQGAWSPKVTSSAGPDCLSLPFYFSFSLGWPLPPPCPPLLCISHPFTLRHTQAHTCLGEPRVLLPRSPHLECPLSGPSFRVLAQELTGPSSPSM